MNDNKNKEVSVQLGRCTRCGQMLPIERFFINEKTGTYYNSCDRCGEQMAEYRKKKREKPIISADVTVVSKIKYKKIISERILNVKKTQLGIELFEDEIFVKMPDYLNAWISSWGRVITYRNGKYSLKSISVNRDGQSVCRIDKCVCDGTAWTTKRATCYVAKEVVKNFIVNDDMKNSVFIWHKGADKQDNYYKHLYPLNKDQYWAIHRSFERYGDDSAEMIDKIRNDMLYKPDTWSGRSQIPTIWGKGYHGEEITNISKDKIYKKWIDMFNRVYNPKIHEKFPRYIGCEVCEEWFNYCNFRKWYLEHTYELPGKTLELDKDILYKGNKVYSPETCCLVPKDINTLFTNSYGIRGEYPVGVSFDKDKGKYRACVNISGKSIKLGCFDTAAEAFKVHKAKKEELIKQRAKKCKNKIPANVYEAMVNWKIEITD